MTIDSKEDVFTFFNKLSGAKRIEVLAGLVHSCIPLEMRFLATLVESLARRDYVTLLEDEHKANSPHELQALCSTDLLADVSPFIRFPGVPLVTTGRPPPSVSPNINKTTDGKQNSDGTVVGRTASDTNDTISPPPQISVFPDVVNETTRFGPQKYNLHPGSNLGQPLMNVVPAPAPVDCLLSNVRKKIVVYLCLLNSTNRVAATILYDAFRKFLSADNLKRHLELSSINVSGMSLNETEQNHHPDNSIPMVQGPSGISSTVQMLPTVHVPILDPQLVAELTLLHTMAIYHPAFQYEQQSLLSYELEKLTELFNNLSPARLFHHHSHQQGLLPPDNFVPFILNQPPPMAVAHYMSESKRSPPLCCYNCGGKGHLGRECTEETLDEATRDTNFQLNFKNPAPQIAVPTIMAQNQVIQVNTTQHQPVTPPVPLSPAATNNKVTDMQNGPGSLTGRKNTLNATVANDLSANHQTLNANESGSYNPVSTPPATNTISQGGSGTKRAPHQLYVAPHMRNRGGDRDSDSSPRSGDAHSTRAPDRVVTYHTRRS